MELLTKLVFFAVIFLNVMPVPVKADMGDTLAWIVGFCIVTVCTCAGIGAYARKQSEFS
jgi:hypothetical protein